MKKTFYFIDHEINCEGTDDGLLFWPEDWTEELRTHGFIDEAISILVQMPQCATRTPWIIGSGTRDLSGRQRTESKSHMSGKAFDMSPMFSDDSILDPSGRIMGLAWNVVSLLLLSGAYRQRHNFVVEGDHLHVQPEAALDPEVMSAVFTMPTWYSWTEIIADDAHVRDIDGSFWCVNTSDGTMRIADRDDIASLMYKLS